MTTRREWKELGKRAFKANYWKCVLAAFLMMVLVYGGLGSAGNGARVTYHFHDGENQPQAERYSSYKIDAAVPAEELDSIDVLPPEFREALPDGDWDLPSPFRGLMLAGVATAMTLTGIGALLLKILVVNPLEVGCRGFFAHNSAAPADIELIGDGFRSWGRCVKTMLRRDIYLLLWGCLFVIPGIIKRYSYRLVPYLLAQDSELSGSEAISRSRELMRGHKWQAFVLELSFLGWDILSGLTAGLLGIFYVNPYKQATDAEFYLAILEAERPAAAEY